MSSVLADAARAPVHTRESVLCTHCGLYVPAGLVEPGRERQFCCSGCRTAFAILHEYGLDRYYELSQRREARVLPSGKQYGELDHPAFHDLYVKQGRDGLSETQLFLEGVHCASCVWLVERVPLAVPGVAVAELDISRSLVRLRWDADGVKLSAIARFLDQLGYPAHPHRGGGVEELRRAEERAMLTRIGVAGALAGNVMMLSAALYSGWLGGMEAEWQRYFRWVSLLVVTPAVLWPGRVFFRGAWSSLRARALHMDVPIALALGAGYLRGVANTVTGRGPIYFDGVATLIFLLLVGRFLQLRASRAAANSAELLFSLTPRSARLVQGDVVSEVPVEALLPGMLLEVRPGETLAADGIVTEGNSSLDLSLLSGETCPVRVAPGARVFAGTLNRSATLRVEVVQAGEASRVGQILRQVESAAGRRAPVVQLANRLAGTFVAVVLALAVVTALVWMRLDGSRAMDNAIALLIVTCPCALALATPLAITVGVGRAARAGILIKGGDALELLARPGLMLLDKTGTVTEGRVTLTAWNGPEWAKPLVLALELHSQHPVAAGFREAWGSVRSASAEDLAHTPGGGVEGRVGRLRVAVGSPAFVMSRARGSIRDARGGADTPVWVAVDGEIVGRAAFGDRLRPDARGAVEALKARGWRVRLLSGDHPSVVRDVARQLGLEEAECRGGATPEEKLRVVEQEVAHGPVVMVGDGVNDAAAIARASVGIGVRGGAEACLSAADVFLARPGIAALNSAVEGSARTLAVIRRNIAFSLAYNVVGAALAVSGLINPLLAAILMPMSSLTVVLLSWRSRVFEEVQ